MAILRAAVRYILSTTGIWLAASLCVAQAAPDTKSLPHVLIVASNGSSAHSKALERVLESSLAIQATVSDLADFRPLIDERIYDGFAYLGEHYYVRPPEAFLADMSRTQKPLLWINYHAWSLSEETRERTGLTVLDQHSGDFESINFHMDAPLESADVTIATARFPARVFYWLLNPDRTVATPGAVISGNLGYLSYLPILDEHHPGFPAFRAFSAATFSQLQPDWVEPPDAETRLAAAKADAFRAGVHLPFVFGANEEETVPYDSDDFHRRLINIKNTGADWVALNQTYYQDGIGAAQPQAHHQGTASLSALENIVEDAHDLGLLVQLSIIVNLDETTRKPNEWRGFIRPNDPDGWWRGYREIVLEAARFADHVGIEALVIGAELNRMQEDEDQWRSLAEDVRQLAQYDGLIGYQVNFDALDTLTWADALDFLSVAAYWPLARSRDPSLDELRASWEKVDIELTASLARPHPNVRLEFGEIGYASQPYAAVFPYSWKPNRSRNLSHEEQLNLYLALEDYLKTNTGIAGVGIFASTLYDRVPGDIGYSPFGKPAEEVVKRIMVLR